MISPNQQRRRLAVATAGALVRVWRAWRPQWRVDNSTSSTLSLWLPLIVFGTVATLFLPSTLAALVLLLVLLLGLWMVLREPISVPTTTRETRVSTDAILPGHETTSLFGRVHPRLQTPFFAFIACFCMIGAAYEFRPAWTITNRFLAVLLLLLGALALWQALRAAPYREPLLIPSNFEIAPMRSSGLVVLAGVSFLVLVVAINIGLFEVNTHLQFILWLLGVVLVTWGLSGAPRLRLPHLDWREVLILLALTLLALFIRLYHLDTAVRTQIDEVHFIGGIRAVQSTPQLPLLNNITIYLPVTMLPLYLNNLAVEALGGPSFYTLRVTQALAGTLNVLALYGLGRALFNRRVALAAALILIGFPLHIHFSRIGMAHMLDTLCGTLAFMFVARGLKTNRRIDWALAGTSLGLTQYFFEGGRLLFPPVAIIWGMILLLVYRQRLREHGRGFLICAVAAVLVASAVYFPMYALDSSRANRFGESGMGGAYFSRLLEGGINQQEFDDLVGRLTNPFLMLVNRAEQVPEFFGGDQPLVLTIFVPLFLLGFVYLIVRWRSPAVVVIVWIAGTIVGNSLLRDQWQAPRYVEVTPALAICIAVGIAYILPLLFGNRKPSERVVSVLAIGCASIVGAIMVGYYFGPHLRLFNTQLRQLSRYGDGVDAVFRAIELNYPQGTQIVVIDHPELDPYVSNIVLTFLAEDTYEIQTYHRDEVGEAFFQQLPREVDYAFFVDPADMHIMNWIEQHFSTVEPPQYSRTTELPANREYVLLYAPRPAAGE